MPERRMGAEGADAPNPRTLLEKLATSPDLRPFRRLLGPLEAHDREHNGDLLRTLRVYLACGGNVSRTADRLYLHRNSIPYRLERIRSVVGLDLNDDRVRLALQLGILAMEKGEDRDEAEHP